MKTKMMKMLLMTGVLMLSGQTGAMASSTQVTFQIPINRPTYAITPSTPGGVNCEVKHGATTIARYSYLNRYLYRHRSGTTVNVKVTPQGRNKFQKGDTWKCWYGSSDSNLDRTRSTLSVHGTL